ncbi:MAG: hypothetical protein QMD36_06740 [Candidatus Aenigmarchaeota archaeon]|nr:hypothetical protein [Candidatus Aenigmarchaeota archaeon]
MVKKKTKLYAISILLCILVSTPKILAAATIHELQTMVIEKRCMKTIRVFNMTTLTAEEYIRVEPLANGSRKVTISLNFTSLNFTGKQGGIRGMCITMTTMVPATTESKASTQSSDYPVGANSVYPGKYWWDDLLFLPKGNNGTHFVTYDHDDNYDTYYPQQWYLSFSLLGAVWEHIHIPTDVMNDWINGVRDRETVLGIIFGLVGGFLAFFGGLLAACLGNLAAVLLTMIGGISAIIGAFLQLLGFTESKWIRDVVTEQYSGDGWTWVGNYRREGFWAAIIDPYIWDIKTRSDIHEICQHRRVCILVEETFGFDQSWGADRDHPMHYSVTLWSWHWVPSGVFAVVPEEYRLPW